MRKLKSHGTTTNKTYIRIKAGPWRDHYLHRIIAAILWDIKYGDRKNDKPARLPDSIEIHHIDGNPLHNCPSNFLLCDAAIHDSFSAGRERMKRK